MNRVRGLFMHPASARRYPYYIITPSSLKKRDNSVGNVGNVGKSEKSPENFPRKVFQNACIAYTTYLGRVLKYRAGRIVGGRLLERIPDKHTNVNRWRVVEVD